MIFYFSAAKIGGGIPKGKTFKAVQTGGRWARGMTVSTPGCSRMRRISSAHLRRRSFASDGDSLRMPAVPSPARLLSARFLNPPFQSEPVGVVARSLLLGYRAGCFT